MNLETSLLMATTALMVAMTINMVISYARMQYSKGQLAGFQECERITQTALLKLRKDVEKQYEEQKKSQNKKDVRVRDTKEG